MVAIVAGVILAVLLVTLGNGTALGETEIQRRLALPPFAYVAETDYDTAKIQAGQFGYGGAAAYIESASDDLVARPVAGSSLQDVAVAPDGSRVYMTDAYEPVLHVLDAETREEILEIPLPGVERHDPTSWMMDAFQEGGYPYSDMRTCSGGVACTPDGSMVLVTSSAGLQVLDAATDEVIRTIPELLGGAIAVSFDGTRVYIACDNFEELAARSFFEWFDVFQTTEDCRLVCIDLATWKVIGEVPTALVGGIAVKPDDSEVFFSEIYKKRVRVVDALTLEDRWHVSTEPSYSIGIGFVPSGAKAYVVCSADNGYSDIFSGEQTALSVPQAEDFFCAVIDTAEKEIVKRIPLEAY
jgi:DNA-binding beta-propeller fold protein YncE